MSQKFDPTKNYKWAPNQEIVIDGLLFSSMLNTLNMELSTPEAQRVLHKKRVFDELSQVVIREVEAGNFKEVVPDQPIETISDVEFEEEKG